MYPTGTEVTLPNGETDDAFKIPTGEAVVTPLKAGQLLGYSDDSGSPLESTGPISILASCRAARPARVYRYR